MIKAATLVRPLISGGPAKRLRLNVLFKLQGLDETAEVLDAAAEAMTITASPIVIPGKTR